MNNKIKIILITPDLTAGGAQRFISLLANNLNPNIFEVHLLIINGAHSFFSIQDSVKVYDLKTKRVRNSLLKIRKLIQTIQPKIVFSTLGHLNLFLAIFRFLFPKDITFIAREAAIVKTSFEDKNQSFSFLFYKKLYQLFLPALDLIVCQSSDMKQSLLDIGVKHGNMVVIQNPVDVLAVQKKMQASIQSTTYEIVTVGRLSYEKGYDRLVEVMIAYQKKYGIIPKTAIIGDGIEKENLAKCIQSAGLEQHIHLLGQQKNPFTFFKNAKLFLMTSRHEGFPNVLIEAGACGLPFVAYDVPGGVKEIIQTGKNGFVVADKDLNGMADQLQNALLYPFDNQWIKNYTNEKFGIATIIKKYETILLEEAKCNTGLLTLVNT